MATPISSVKISDATVHCLASLIRAGNYAITACNIAGISEQTYYGWLQIAESDAALGATAQESIYIRLQESVNKAIGESEAELAGVIRSAAVDKKQWLPAITFLERRHPDRWGRKDRTRIDIEEHKTVTITHVEYNLSGQQSLHSIDGESRELNATLTQQDKQGQAVREQKALQVAREMLDAP